MATDHIWTYMARGSLYALTSACALVAGYIVQKSGFDWHDIPYLAVPVIASIYFFMCYASRFPTRESSDTSEEATSALVESEAIKFFPVVAALLLVISLLARLASTRSISVGLLVAFGLYVVMYGLYGRFLLRHPSATDIPIVRHRLVWPVVLSIGIGLYYGFNFSRLDTSAAVLLAPILILALFVASEIAEFKMPLFAATTGIVFLAMATLVILARAHLLSVPYDIEDYFLLMLFSLTVSAYLAVFETWTVTADIALRLPAEAGSTPDRPMPKAVRYSTAALAALMVSVWIMPMLFVFSDYGTVFLVGFLVHATLAFVLWYFFGRSRFLTTWPWGAIKIIAGILFLVVMVLATIFPQQPSTHLIKWIVKTEGMGILLVPVVWLLGGLWVDLLRKRRKRNFLKRVLVNRVNLVRVLGVLCWIACAILITLLSTYHEDSAEYYKTELAFDAYVGCIVVCVIVEMFDRLTGSPIMILVSKFMVGLLYLSRSVTTCLLGLCVFLPSIVKGNSIGSSTLFALPFMLAAIGGFALNDYFDVEKDLVNKPYRALPSGRLSKPTVIWISISLLSLALALSWSVSNDWKQFSIYGLTICGVASYNVFVKYISLSKTVLTSLVSSLPIWFSVLTFDFPMAYVLLAVATAFFVLGREWLMDVKDVKGDRSTGMETFAMRVGLHRAAKVGFLFQLISIALLVPLAVIVNSSLGYLLLAAILLSVALLHQVWMSGSIKHQAFVIRLLWAPMLVGILMLIA